MIDYKKQYKILVRELADTHNVIEKLRKVNAEISQMHTDAIRKIINWRTDAYKLKKQKEKYVSENNKASKAS